MPLPLPYRLNWTLKVVGGTVTLVAFEPFESLLAFEPLVSLLELVSVLLASLALLLPFVALAVSFVNHGQYVYRSEACS